MSSSSPDTPNSSSLSSETPSHFSSPEGRWGAAAAASQGAVGRRLLLEHLNPSTQATEAAGPGSMAPHPLLRPAPQPVAPRPNLVSRATLPRHHSPPTSPERLVAASGNPLASKPCAQLKCPGSPTRADGSAKLSRKDLGPAQEEEGLKRDFVTRQEFLVVERELEEVREELKCLKWKVRHLGETVQPLAEESKRYNGYTLMELKAMVQSEEDPYKAAQKILMALFSDVYLLQHPMPDQACNSKSLPKPRIDPELYTVYCDILQSIFPGIGSQAPRERDLQQV